MERGEETHQGNVFPKVKTLEEFDVETASHIPSSRLRKLAEGEYVGRTEPVIFLVHQNRGPFLWPVLWNQAHRNNARSDK